MTASATVPTPSPSPTPSGAAARPAPRPATPEFQLVESADGWRLTMTLTDQLREALAGGGDVAERQFTVRVAPNLVPGEPFEARLVIEEPDQRA